MGFAVGAVKNAVNSLYPVRGRIFLGGQWLVVVLFYYFCPNNHLHEINLKPYHMKKLLMIFMALCLSMGGGADLSAQSFFKKLGNTVKKEVEKGVEKKVKKEVRKGVNKTINKTSSKKSESKSKTETNASSTSQSSSQSSSFADSQENHLKILEERGEIVRPVVVEGKSQKSQASQGPTTGKLNGHQWVDLGLPSGTRWATCNIGATQPQQAGSHFAWGEVATKASYTEGNSKTNGKSMNDISGNATYDVATAKWGKGWRMPTKEEFDELVEYCSFPQYEKLNGRWGQRFTNQKNGRSIFLPATGSKEMGSEHRYPSVCGNYWTSTPHKDSYNNGAHEYHYGAAMGEMGVGERSSGYGVRAVIDNDAMITVPSQGQTNGHQWVDLGLPSGNKWATCNLGAKSSEEFGNTYQWANTTPNTSDIHTANDASGKKMSRISGNKTYDAASAQWGSTWKMPTKADFQELMEHCTWEYTTMGRLTGLKAISKKNGNYIFFPIEMYSEYAEYWTATPLVDSYNYDATTFAMSKDSVGPSSKNRSKSYPIRPITK